jgi:hypothetical protein
MSNLIGMNEHGVDPLVCAVTVILEFETPSCAILSGVALMVSEVARPDGPVRAACSV